MTSAVIQECVGRRKGPGDWQFALNGRGGATPRSFGALLAATERGEAVTLDSGGTAGWTPAGVRNSRRSHPGGAFQPSFIPRR